MLVCMNGDDLEQRRQSLLGLARLVNGAGSEEDARLIMQAATGLSLTDAVADRAELDRRVHARAAAEVEGDDGAPVGE